MVWRQFLSIHTCSDGKQNEKNVNKYELKSRVGEEGNSYWDFFPRFLKVRRARKMIRDNVDVLICVNQYTILTQTPHQAMTAIKIKLIHTITANNYIFGTNN